MSPLPTKDHALASRTLAYSLGAAGSLLVLVITTVSSLRAQGPSPLPSTGDSTNPIVGEWVGAYFAFPELVAVRLNIRSLPMDRIEGECELSPAKESRFHNVGTQGSYSLKGLYTPWATEFSFTPDKSLDPRR